MKKIKLISFAILLATSVFSQKKDTIKVFNGLGFSCNYELVASYLTLGKTGETDIYEAPFTDDLRSVNLGLYYKGFGISYSLPIASESTYSGFKSFFYSKRWGIDLYYQKFQSYYTVDQSLTTIWPEDYYWAKEMKMTNNSVNLYFLFLGKRKLSDYFCYPAQTRKSKIGLFGIMSLGKRKVYDTQGLFRPEQETNFSDIYKSFDFEQFNATIGLGLTASLFLKNFYGSTSLALGYNYLKASNEMDSGSFSEVSFEPDVMNFKFFIGWQGDKLKLESGWIMDSFVGNINENYYLAHISDYAYAKISLRFPTKKEKLKL